MSQVTAVVSRAVRKSHPAVSNLHPRLKQSRMEAQRKWTRRSGVTCKIVDRVSLSMDTDMKDPACSHLPFLEDGGVSGLFGKIEAWCLG